MKRKPVPEAVSTAFQAFGDVEDPRIDGRAPEGMHWHHIVEQSQAPQLGQRAIQSVENVVAIPIEAHLRINAFYSSKQLISHPNTVRDWLRGQSFEKQYEYGVERLREVLGY